MRLELESNEARTTSKDEGQDHQLAATASELERHRYSYRYMYGIWYIYAYIVENAYLLCGPWASGGCVFIFWFWQCGQNIVYANNAGEGTAHRHTERNTVWNIPWNEQKQFGFLTVISMLRSAGTELSRAMPRAQSGNKAKQFLIVTALALYEMYLLEDKSGLEVRACLLICLACVRRGF